MKLKQWLSEKADMSYAEYKKLPDIDKWSLQGEFDAYNRGLQKKKSMADSTDMLYVRKMTKEELAAFSTQAEKERERYETSLGIGGIDERNNYTALHHR